MSHEQSRTFEEDGFFVNRYGEQTPKAGQPLAPKYPFEKSSYPTEAEAIDAAQQRSTLEGQGLQGFLEQTQPAGLPSVGDAGSELSSWLSGSQETTKLKLSLQEGAKQTPTEATRLLQLQTKTGLPRDFLAENTPYVESQLAGQAFDAETFRKTSPAFADWLAQHPDHAAAAREDLTKMNYLERQIRYIGVNKEIGQLQAQLSDLGEKAWNGIITSQERVQQSAIEKRLGELELLGKATDITGFGEQIPGISVQQWPVNERVLAGMVKGGAEGLVAGVAGGALIGGAPGATAGGLAMMGPAALVAGGVEAGKFEMHAALLDYEKLKDENGNPLDPQTIKGLSLMAGAANGTLEMMFGMQRLALKIPGVRSLTREGLKELLKTPTTRAAVLHFASNIGATMAGEGITEALQMYVTKLGGAIGQTLQDGGSILDRVFNQENFAQAVQEARGGAQGGGGMALPLSSVTLAADLKLAQDAKKIQEAFANIGTVAANTKLRETLPGTLRSIMEQATKDGPVETLYVPTEAFNTYFQSKGEDPRAVAAQITGSPEAYDQAIASGSDLAIPTADYAEKIAGTEHNAFFAQEIRPSLESMNAREADQWIADRVAENQIQQEGVQAGPAQDPLLQIRQEIAGQLEAMGFDPGVIDQYAQLFESRYRARAERRGLGENPLELFKQLNLQIQRQMPEILQTLGQHQTELTALLDRLRSGDVPKPHEVFGKSLFEALREQGGVQDQGGELAALGIDEGRQTFKKKLIQAKGLTLEEAATRMHEAGYLPESGMPHLLEALKQEAAGRPVYVPGREDPRLFDMHQKLEELRQYLHELGVNLHTTANEAVQQQLERSLQASARPAVEGETFAQSEPHGEIHKGHITFGHGSISINLLERADLSTFLHETGHLYLNELIDDATTAGIPQQLQEDLDSILKWMGLHVRVANGAEAIKSAIGREQHEQFARGFEAYTLEGTSPSVAMREAFARFRQWLIQVYQLMTGKLGATPEAIGKALNVKLTHEVRRVMNRMVATEAEITAMEQIADVHPMFTDALSAGMTEREFSNYRELVTKAGMTERERLQSQLMAQFARERTVWWQEQREQVKAEVTASANQQRDYIALSILQNGLMPDGSALPVDINPGKLSRKDVARVLGKDFVARMPKGTMTTAGGISVEHAATLFGYQTPEEFLTALANLRPKAELIEAETDLQMTRQYGDPLIDGTLHEKARAAVLNEEREQIIEVELAALRKKQREVTPFLKAQTAEHQAAAREGRTVLSALVPPRGAVRDLARRQIARQRVRDIKPQVHFLAAQKASRAATTALAKQDYIAAGLAKQKESLNLALFKEASAAVAETQRILDHMASLRKKSVQEKLGKAGSDYLEQINAIMTRYEFTPIPLLDLQRRQSLREWIAEKEKNGETAGEEFVIPEAILLEARKMNYKELPFEELTGVRDTIQQIQHFAQLKNRLLAKQAQRDKEEARTELIGALIANLKVRPPQALTESGMTKGEKLSRLSEKFNASLIKMEQLVEEFDGGVTGPWHEYFWNPAVDAQAAEADYTKSITGKIAEAVVNIPVEIRKRMLDVVNVPGIQNRITRKDLLGVALNVGNNSNRTKLLKGMGWSEMNLRDMLDQLTQEEWTFVQHVWDTLESMWPEIAALQKKLTGIEPAKVEIHPVTTKFGVYKGGYYPIMYSAVLSSQGGLQLSSTFGKLLEDNYVRATLPSGYRKARVEDFSRPFDLDVDRLPSHIAGVIKDLTHRTWLIDANWIVTDPKIRAALQQTLGDATTLRVADWVGQVANDRNGNSGRSLAVWQQMIEHFRMNTVIVAMGFKWSVMASQLAGLAPAIETLGGKTGGGAKWFGIGVGLSLSRPAETYRFMTEKSGEMRHRITNRDRDLRDKLRDLQGRTDLLAEIQQVSLMGIGYAELLVSMPTWLGGYRKALSEGLADEEAVRAGDRAVRLSQGAAGAKDLAAVAGKSDQMMRLITMFYTPFSALYNRLRAIGHDVDELKDLPRAAVRLWLTVTLAATLGEVLAGHGPDKDEDWWKWWTRIQLAYPFLGVPLLRDAIGAITTGYGYQFSPIAQALETTTHVAQSTKKVAAGEKEWEEMAPQAAKAFSYFVGLPSSQLIVTGKYLHDLNSGKENPDDMFEFAKKILYARPKE